MNNRAAQRRRNVIVRTLLLVILTGCWVQREATAQPSYSFSVDHGVYSDLTDATVLDIPVDTALAETYFGVDLNGEVFTLYGEEYGESIEITGRGVLGFDNDRHSVVIDGFLSILDRFDHESRIAYQIDRSGEESILKVEWKRLAVIDDPEVAVDDYVNFQIWLYQSSGVVELRYGENTVNYTPGKDIGGGPFIGVFQFVQKPFFKILEKNWIIGDVNNPEYDLTTKNFESVQGCPANGTIFRFTPNEAAGVTDKKTFMEYALGPNPTHDVMTLTTLDSEHSGESVRVRITDLTGRTISDQTAILPLDLELPRPGLYFCKIFGKEGVRIYPVIRQ